MSSHHGVNHKGLGHEILPNLECYHFQNSKLRHSLSHTKSVPLCGPFRSWGNGTGEGGRDREGGEGDEMSLVAPIGHPSLDVAGGRENALQSSFHGPFEAHPGQSGSDPQKCMVRLP